MGSERAPSSRSRHVSNYEVVVPVNFKDSGLSIKSLGLHNKKSSVASIVDHKTIVKEMKDSGMPVDEILKK